MGRIKSRFVRALVESLQQETNGSALTRLRHGLAPHWLSVLSRDVFAAVEQDSALELEAGIELLVAIERVLSGGSGKLMVRAAAALAARVLYGSPGLVVPGDLVRTLQHLQAPFEQPFLDANLHFSVRGSALEFVLEVELSGLPSAARWLSWTALGYAQAAASFSGQDPLQFRFDSQVSADLARITGRRVHSGLVKLPGPALAPAPSAVAARVTPARRRTPPPSLAARVEEILSRAQPRHDADSGAVAASQRPPSGVPARQSERAPGQSGTRAAVRPLPRPARKSAR